MNIATYACAWSFVIACKTQALVVDINTYTHDSKLRMHSWSQIETKCYKINSLLY